jgi:DNA-binding transcriptional LysR family regulator
VELRQYRHVLALADRTSFLEASEALGISQPALTESLFQIEREVGQRLFDRHGQTIAPTVFGAIVVDTAGKMLDSQEAMTRTIGQTAALDAGELYVGVGPYTADTWMGQVSGRLLQRYPRLRFSIRVEPWESLPPSPSDCKCRRERDARSDTAYCGCAQDSRSSSTGSATVPNAGHDVGCSPGRGTTFL